MSKNGDLLPFYTSQMYRSEIKVTLPDAFYAQPDPMVSLNKGCTLPIHSTQAKKYQVKENKYTAEEEKKNKAEALSLAGFSRNHSI